jgi:hypothetical protein
LGRDLYVPHPGLTVTTALGPVSIAQLGSSIGFAGPASDEAWYGILGGFTQLGGLAGPARSWRAARSFCQCLFLFLCPRLIGFHGLAR